MPCVWHGWTPMGEKGAPHLAWLGSCGRKRCPASGMAGPPWERQVPCVWHRGAPMGERGALRLARLDPRTYACLITLWAGAGAGPRSTS